MKKLAIIINKAAGRGKVLDAAKSARRSLWGWPIEIMAPVSKQDLQDTCANLNKDEYEAVVIIGGDGTIHQAIRGLVKSRVPLMPFPGGTANDLAQELGLQGQWGQVQELLDNCVYQDIDLISVNSTPFVTVAGIGVGSILTAELNEKRSNSTLFQAGLKKLRSELYTFMSAKTVLLRRDYVHHVHIQSSSFDEKIKTAAVFVCNQNFLAGDLRVAPASVNHDQVFNVMIFPEHRPVNLLAALWKLKTGRITRGDFIIFSTDRVRIHSLEKRPMLVFGDGESLVEDSELEFRIMPKALSVYRERRMKFRRQA